VKISLVMLMVLQMLAVIMNLNLYVIINVLYNNYIKERSTINLVVLLLL